MVTPIIHINALNKFYGNQQVLNNIHLNFYSGECVGLMGPNGSGKSTLIKCLLGLVKPTSGLITINGIDTTLGHIYRKNIGYMPQINRFPGHMKVQDVITLLKKIRFSEQREINFDMELFELFEISSMLHKSLSSLSGGMRQKVSASLAFMFNPNILILDEPTAALDPLSNEQFKAKIKQVVSDGALVLITSHIISELDEMVGRIIYLLHGSLQFDYDRDLLKNNYNNDSLNRIIVKLLNNINN